MVLAAKYPGSYIAWQTFAIRADVDIEGFQCAWDQTVAVCANMRTRIVFIDGQTVQAIIKDDAGWEPNDSRIFDPSHVNMGFGTRLCRFGLTTGNDGTVSLRLAIHHSVIDGWTMGLIRQRLESFYRETELLTPLQPYSRFINYVLHQDYDAGREYWKTQLQGAKRAVFPASSPFQQARPTSSSSSSSTARSIVKPIYFHDVKSSSITTATDLRAAWALLLARYCKSDDICFGTSISGRHATVKGLEHIAGPLVATVPTRIRINHKQSITGFLQNMQKQASGIVAYKQFSIQNISKLNADIRNTCDFSSLLVIQPARSLHPPLEMLLYYSQ